MKIILLQNVKGLGKIGDIKTVSEGYARNFLFPKKLATIGNEGAIKGAHLKKEGELAQQKAEEAILRTLAEKLAKERIVIRTKAKSGKLFGSITRKQIIDELKKNHLEVSEKCIIMEEAIKKTGTYKIGIRLSAQVGTKVELEVSGE